MADNTGIFQFQNAKEYAKAKIAEVDSQIDTRDNTGIGDLLIKPVEAFLQPIFEEVKRISENQSLIGGEALTETDVDALIANLFLTRLQGAKARGTVRVFFSEAVAVTIPEASEFVDAVGTRFFSLSEVTITANQMSLNREGDFFFVETLVEAEEVGEAGNVAQEGIVDFVSGPSNVLKVDNPDDFTGGTPRETNTSLIDRAKEAITVRDLVSKPAIKTVLRDQEDFAFIKDIRVIGFEDPEMERDFLVGDNMQLGLLPPVDVIGSTTGIHIGGKVDIYIRTVGITTETVLIEDLKATVFLRPKDKFDPTVDPPTVMFVPLTKRPIIEIVALQEVDAITGDPIGSPLVEGLDFDVVVDNFTLRFSVRDRLKLIIHNGLLIGGNLQMTYTHSNDIVLVQSFVSDEDKQRVVTADLLVKFSQPAFVDFTVSFTLDATSEETAATIETKINNFINNLEVGARLEASDIVDLIYDNGGTFVQLPFTMTVTVLNDDGTKSVQTSENTITIPTTAGYLARNITVVEV